MMMTIFDRYKALMSPDGVEAGGSPSTPSVSPSVPSGGSSSDSGSAPPSSPAPEGSPTPTPSPSTAPSRGPDTSPSLGESLDFESIFGDGSQDSVAALAAGEAPPAKPASPEVPPPSPPAAPAAEATPAAVPPVVPPPAAPGAPDQSTPPAQPGIAAGAQYIDPYDPATLSQHLVQHEGEAVQLIADQLFQMSPEEKEALEQDVIGTIPKLLAKVFVKSQQNMLTQLGRMIPVMTQRHLEAIRRNMGNESQFYTRWPDIKATTHGESVRKYAAVYRQMHPNATLEQMIEDLGPMVMMANKIVPSVGAPGANGNGAVRPAPTGAGGRPAQPSPFVPAGAGPVASSRQPELSPWEAMFAQPDG